MRTRLVAIVLLLVTVVTACGGDDDSSTPKSDDGRCDEKTMISALDAGDDVQGCVPTAP